MGENGGYSKNEPCEDEQDCHRDSEEISHRPVCMLAHDLAVVDQQQEEHYRRRHRQHRNDIYDEDDEDQRRVGDEDQGGRAGRRCA